MWPLGKQKQYGNPFTEYRRKSYCNFIYKLKDKVFALCLKPNQSDVILEEQFVFLWGRQIHDGISSLKIPFTYSKLANNQCW